MRMVITDSRCGLSQDTENLYQFVRRFKFKNYDDSYSETEDSNDSKFYALLKNGFSVQKIPFDYNDIERKVIELKNKGVREFLFVIPSTLVNIKDNKIYKDIIKKLNSRIEGIKVVKAECPFDGLGMGMYVKEAIANLDQFNELEDLASYLKDCADSYRLLYYGENLDLKSNAVEVLKKEISGKYMKPICEETSKKMKVINSTFLDNFAVHVMIEHIRKNYSNLPLYVGTTTNSEIYNLFKENIDADTSIEKMHINKLSGVSLGRDALVVGVKKRTRL